jgi:hypothetical protein
MPATDPPKHPRSIYTPEALAACEKALRTILTKVGPWGQRLVLIGGMTPRYLVGQLPVEVKEHVGTTDLDIVVGVTISTEEEEAYRTLQQNLKEAHFAPARNVDTGQEETFRWARQVDGVGVQLEFFCPVGTGRAGQLLRNPGSNVGSRINLLPFLVLKAFAIDERDKTKDSYDVVWILSAYKDGPRSAVEDIAKSPVLGHPDVAAAMERLRSHFQTPEHRGPSQYANFELTVGDEDERSRLRRYAHGAMAEFFRHWEELKLPG